MSISQKWSLQFLVKFFFDELNNTLNIDDGVKHNNSIDNVHEEEVKESESEHRFYYKLSTN